MPVSESDDLRILTPAARDGVPRVSVVIPAYNVAPYIAASLSSVLAQTYRNFEVIVINDGSADALETALEPYRGQIHYIEQANLGAGPARNAGILQARGELVAFLDGDDLWRPDFLASQVAFLDAHNYDLVYADARIFGESALAGRTFMQDSPSAGEANFASLLGHRCNVITSGTVARRQALLDAGLFEWENVRGQDFNMWLRMAHQGARFGYQKKVLLDYRVRLDSHSGNSVQRLERNINTLQRTTCTMQLNAEEQHIRQTQLAWLENLLRIEKGKSFLLQGDFTAARTAFAQANGYRKSIRLQTIIWLLRWSPRLLLKIYRAQRAADIRFVPQS